MPCPVRHEQFGTDREVFHARLANCGISATDDDLVSSADVAAEMVAPGSRAFVLAEDGVREALQRRGVTVVDDAQADVVIVGWTRSFDFDSVTKAAQVVRAGARLIGTNEDPTHPTPSGLTMGGGAILAAVATAAERRPEVAGKPHPTTATAIIGRAADLRVMVGDRPATDGALAAQLAIPFALVLSGVTAPDAVPTDPAPDAVAPDLATLVRSTLDLGAK